MASRIVVIEEPCEHGRWPKPGYLHEIGCSNTEGFEQGYCADEDGYHDNHGYCPCGSRRVFTEGEFECVDNVDEKWLYLVTEEVHRALAGGES